jgi:uncharacterized delta-60 repeat protein
MKYVALCILILAVTLAGGAACSSNEASPTPTPAPSSTPSPSVTASPTPVVVPSPTPDAVTEAWEARYNGPGGGADWAFDLTVDGSGNVYVTGKSFSKRPYDYSCATVKYNAEGNRTWVARYDGPGGDDDVGHAIAVDGSGNVYVTGKSYNSLHEDYAYATIKYDANGNQLWVARYDGAGQGDDIAWDVAVDSAGNVVVTGSSGGDFATVKYDSAGKQLWAARYAGTPDTDEGAVAVAVDSQGNVYVAGTSQKDYATIKYSPDGDQLWVARYDGSGLDDTARDMVVDGSGNVYVTGRSFVTTDFDYHYATVKYDTDGTQLWVAPCIGLTCGTGEAEAIAVDSSGNVYVTGRGLNLRTWLYCWATVKYNAAGQQQWVGRYDGSLASKGGPLAVAVDGWGNAYVTGESYVGSKEFDYAYTTIKYDTDGNQEWLIAHNSAPAGWDSAVAIAVDSSGNAYVTGKSDGGTSNADYLTIKYVSRDSGP